MDETALYKAMIDVSIIIIVVAVLGFTRWGKNAITMIIHPKKYVVCHVKSPNTDFVDDWLVRPEKDFYTRVGKYQYDLNPKYSLFKWRGRLHFSLDENNAIPKHFKEDDTQEILFQVQELKTALENRAANFLFAKRENIALIICAVALVISLVVAIYGIYEFQQMKPVLQWLYEHPGEIVKVGSSGQISP